MPKFNLRVNMTNVSGKCYESNMEETVKRNQFQLSKKTDLKNLVVENGETPNPKVGLGFMRMLHGIGSEKPDKSAGSEKPIKEDPKKNLSHEPENCTEDPTTVELLNKKDSE